MYQTPDRFRWKPADQSRFINETKKMAQALVEEYEAPNRWGSTSRAERLDPARYARLIDCRYREGRLAKLLKIDYDQFFVACHPIRYYGWRPGHAEYSYAKCPYRNGNSYRRADTHQPKDHEPTPKEVWREAKLVRRDKAKHHGWHYRPTAGIAYWKTRSARSHRAWVQDRLHHDDWDAFGQSEYKPFVDSYEYD
jgi:hypothetical protein